MRETDTPTAVEPIGLPEPAESVPPPDTTAAVARAERILSGDVRSDDYLPVTPEIAAEVDAHLRYIREELHIEPTPEAIQHIRNSFALQMHHPRDVLLCRETEHGVIVLADNPHAMWAIRSRFTDYRQLLDYAMTFPYPT